MALSLLLKSEPNWAKIFTKAVSVSTLDRGRLQRALHAWRVKNERRLFILFCFSFFFFKTGELWQIWNKDGMIYTLRQA